MSEPDVVSVDPVSALVRPRGPRPSRKLVGEHDFVTPSLPTPQIARPTSWPATEQSFAEVLSAAEELEADASSRKELLRRVHGVELLLGWLSGFPGRSWQQRWLASGSDAAGRAWTDRVDIHGLQSGDKARTQCTGAAGRLVLLDVIRPSYNWLYSAPSNTLYRRYEQLHDREAFAALTTRCDSQARLTPGDRRFAFVQLVRILMHNGGHLAQVSVEDCVEAYRAQTGYASRQHSHWYTLLREEAILPATAAPTIYAASRRGQLSIEELVDGYDVACRPVRDLFVNYLRERQPGLDYSTIRQLTSKLVLLFWRDLELHEPAIASLHLSDEAARGWKERLQHVRYGNHRLGHKREDPYSILMAVRAFYADLSHWALEDPARWAPWAAPSPVDSRDLAGMTKQLKRRQSRMHQRIRELAPLLPRLVEAAAILRTRAAQLLTVAQRTAPGEVFTAGHETLRRTALVTDPALGGGGRVGVIYATAIDGTGPRRNLVLEADKAFWAWAFVEVFRHTGVRIEEMLELTHRSFVSYTLPTTGEVIPLLQVTPSKTDRERLLVISPELAEVFAQIIARVRDDSEHVPLLSRYDHAERLHSPPLPFLFQRWWGLRATGISHRRVKESLDQLVAAAGITNTDGSPARFTPHDFRRIFATEAVSSGLPVHIAAKLLGHESLATTQTYIAVYDQDVIDHHRAFIARRRTLRPSEEYREPSETEWDEFLGHFAKRKVELGTCGRAYGTPCQHEHACVRCPMLRPDPAQQHRLEEIITNLGDRLTEANQRGWFGEIDGLETSLAAAGHKLAQMRRATATTTNLGLPAMPGRRTPAP